RGSEWWPRLVPGLWYGSAAADHADVVGDPAVVGHAGTLALRTVGDGRGPEPDLLEIVHAVGGATLGGLHPRPVGAGGRHDRVGAEPDREVGLQVRRERVLHPLVGAVRMRRLGMHHRRVGPAGRALLRDRRGDRQTLG